MNFIPLNSDNSLNNSNLLKNKLDILKSVKPQNSKNLTDTEKAGFEKAARGFESMFIHMMYKQMKNAMLDKPSDADKSFGADTLSGFTDLKFTEQLSNSGTGIGIAKLIYQQLTGEQLPSKTEYIQRDIPMNDNDQTLSFNHQLFPNVSDLGSSITNKLEKFQPIIDKASDQFGIPKNLIKSIINTESAGNPNAISKVGAKGLMQLMDGTAKDLGVENAFNPEENIMGGTKYIKMMLDRYEGDIDKALAAYNAGPGNVDKYGGIPPFNETQAYVKKVKNYLEKLQ